MRSAPACAAISSACTAGSGAAPAGCASGGNGGWHSASAPSAARSTTTARLGSATVSPCRSANDATHFTMRSGATSTQRPPGSPAATRRPPRRSDVEAEGAQLLAAVVGDLVGTPRGQPHPVDLEVGDDAFQGRRRLVLDHVGERAGRAGEGHVDGGDPVRLQVDPVDEPEIDHVDAEFGVDHVPQRLQHILGVLGARSFGHITSVVAHVPPPSPRAASAGAAPDGAGPAIAWAVASFHAIQGSRAHLILAGYLDTPANATASPSTSSLGSASPFDCIRARNSSETFIASLTCFPATSSVITDALA